ncbi:helix-turn-helix domain-containing protein [Deinococcus sp.]|uniref:helix-turn-helix domain-containing protein n=1 Tax=Deinococcus sp. TaxID=47478 RepID=UPI003CC6BD2D
MTDHAQPLKARRNLAHNLRSLRKAQGLSQEVLADRAGVHRTYLGAIERGEQNVSIDNIERIANALGCNIEELVAEAVE